ncbi:cold shock domain-containing protein [Frankia sp. AgB32]|nr:cold shock domain-containing protein [Frankia sp. AgB32]
MMARCARLMAGVIPVALATVACAGATTGGWGGASGGTDASADPGADTVVALRVESVGGFVTPTMLVGRLPVVAVYSDGRVIDVGPQIAIYPGPALPNVQLRRISTASVRRLVSRAAAAGIATERDFGQPPIADATSTRFTIRTASGVGTAEVPALLESDGTGLTAHQRAARQAARDLYDALTDLPGTLGRGAVSESAAYTPTALAAIAAPKIEEPCAASPADGAPGGPCGADVGRDVRPWPGPPLPGKSVGPGSELGCVTASGDEAATLLAAARTAVSTTSWTSGGRQWSATFRPLLPDESSCADLTASR